MTDRSKFEQMLEYLLSEQQDKAQEIFHQLVVEKSREIYENILSEDFDQEVDEADLPDDEADPEGGEDDGEVGGDATDDFLGDIENDDSEEEFDGEGEGDLEDRVVDLEDALDDLRSEFEQMMAGEESEEGEYPGIHDGEEGGDEFGGDEFGGDDEFGDEEPIKDSFDIGDNFMREYIEKVSAPKHGDDGVNTKSPLAGKNDMGGTTANIAKGGEAKGEGTKGGLLNPSAKEENFGNINVPGGKAGKTAFKKREPGHGAEKKGSGDNGDKSAGSPINGVKSRAK